MKNKTISIFMMLVLISTLLFGFAVTPVIATEGDVFNTFEGATVNDNFSTMNGITFDGDQTNSACAVDDDPVYAGSRSWKHEIMNNLDPYYINLSVPTKSISFWWRITDYQYCDIDMYFFNTDDELIIWLEWEDSYFSLYNHDHENYDTEIHHVGMATDDCWNFLRITMNATDEVSFISNFDSLTSWSNITDTPRYIHDNWNISYIRVKGDEDHIGVTQYMWIDNFAYNSLLGGDEEAGEGYGDLSGYIAYCDTDGDPTQGFVTGGRYLETKWGILLNSDTPVKAVDLYVGAEQYDSISSTKTDYRCYINGFDMGTPDYFVEQGTLYMLRWYLSTAQTVSDGYAIFEFSCSKQYDGKYWFPAYEYDSFGGGAIIHNNPDYFGDGTTLIGDVSGNLEGSQFNANLWICLYYGFQQDNPSYDDNIYVVQNDNTPEDTFYEYNNIKITGSLSLLKPNTYVQLNHDGVRYTGGIYGGDGAIVSNDQNYVFLLSFNPTFKTADGSWNCTLMRGGSVIDSYNFTIVNMSDIDYNGHITSYPNPQGVSQPVEVVWLYNKTYFDNLYAYVYMSLDNSFDSSTDLLLKSMVQDDGQKTYYHSDEGVIYFFLVVKDDGIYYPIDVSDPQIIGVSVLDTINTKYDEIHLTDDYPYGTEMQHIYGSHQYAGRWVQIFLNNLTVKDVSMTPFFDFEYQYAEAGMCHVSLAYFNETGSWIVLDTIDYVVIDDREASTPVTPILPGLGATWGMIMGLMIVSFFTLLPLLLTHMTNQKGFNFTIPAIVYVLFAGIGALISFAFELFQDWVLFFIIAIGIIALGILYLIGQRQNVGG